jgi:uncharacterized membrane protein AbrB (regulator of aidB expression)
MLEVFDIVFFVVDVSFHTAKIIIGIKIASSNNPIPPTTMYTILLLILYPKILMVLGSFSSPIIVKVQSLDTSCPCISLKETSTL